MGNIIVRGQIYTNQWHYMLWEKKSFNTNNVILYYWDENKGKDKVSPGKKWF